MKSRLSGIILISLSIILIGTGSFLLITKEEPKNGSNGVNNEEEQYQNNENENNDTDEKRNNNENNDNTNTENTNSDDNSEKTPTNEETNQEKANRIISNIDFELNCDTLDNECVAIIKNNNNETANVALGDLHFYDINDEELGYVNGPLYANGLGPNKTGYITIYKDHIFGEYENYDHYKASFYLQMQFTAIPHNDDIETIGINETDKGLEVILQNNSSDVINSLKVIGLFYKDDKIVGTDFTVDAFTVNDEYLSDVNSNQQFKVSIDKPKSKLNRNELISYDRYDIVITEAYKSVSNR